MGVQNPVIVVPGITASALRDEYPVNPETAWATFTKAYDRIALHPDNLRYEWDEPARVVRDQAFAIPYNELIAELRHDLTPREDQPTPVYPFAYDWRQPLEATEQLLGGFIDEVIERTKLLPHYHKAGYAAQPKVDLVGHSMGGLIIAGYLQRAGPAARVGKVATLGSPFRGSLEAPLKITTGLSSLGAGRASSREREVSRLTPGLPDDIYDAGAWQPSILETVGEYIRLYGLDKTRRRASSPATAPSLTPVRAAPSCRHKNWCVSPTTTSATGSSRIGCLKDR